MSSLSRKEEKPPTIAELPRHLKVIRQLGRGAYGTVYLCEDASRGGEQVAVKHAKSAIRHGKSILREIRLLARLKHENLLHLIDFPAVPSPDFEDVFLVLPYMPADLHKVIQGKQLLSDRHVQAIVCQILRGLACLHVAGVAHRDLKPANILLASDCSLKICDFGLARGDMGDPQSDEPEQALGVLTEYVVTRWYRAPEVMLLPKQYTSALDLWSVGCILCEMLGRKALFPGKNHIDMINRIAEVMGTPTDVELTWLPKSSDAYKFLRTVCPQSKGEDLAHRYPKAPPVCIEFALALLQWDPEKRLTATEALQHQYLRSYRQKDTPEPPEPFDWSFDGFKPTASAVRERLYKECSKFHPEILDRDRPRRSSETSSRSVTPPRNTTPRRLSESTSGYGVSAAAPPAASGSTASGYPTSSSSRNRLPTAPSYLARSTTPPSSRPSASQLAAGPLPARSDSKDREAFLRDPGAAAGRASTSRWSISSSRSVTPPRTGSTSARGSSSSRRDLTPTRSAR